MILRLACLCWMVLVGSFFLPKIWDPATTRRAIADATGGPYDASGAAEMWTGHATAALSAAGVLLAAAGWGGGLRRWLGLRGALAPHAGLGLGLIALGLAVFGAGVTGLLRPAGLLLLVLPALPALRRGFRAGPAGSDPVTTPVAAAPEAPRSKFDRMGKNRQRADPGAAAGGPGVVARIRDAIGRIITAPRLLGAACAPFLLLSLIPALSPELGWDALTYHLRIPDHWLAAGRIFPIPFSLGSYYPFMAEQWFIPAMAFGGDGGAKLLNWAMLPLIAAIHVRLGRAAGRPVAGWAGALLWCGLPAAQVLAGQAYNDLEIAWLAVLMVAATLERGRGWRLAAGILLGGATGCKYTAAWVGVCCACVWTWREWRGDRRWVRGVLLPGGVSLFVFAVWPLRDWLYTGNPVFPMLPGTFPAAGWNPWYTAADAARIVPGSVPQSALDSLLGVLNLPGRLATLYQANGVFFGPLLTMLVPGLLLARGGAGSFSWKLAAMGGVMMALWEVSRGMDSRYLLPAAALLALPAGEGLACLASGWRWGVPAAAGTGLVLAALAGHFASYESRMYAPWRVALGVEPRRVYLARAMLPNHEYYPMAERINTELPRQARILLISDIVSHYHDRLMVFDTQQVMPPIGIRWARRGEEPRALRRRLRRLGITHVFHSSRLIAFEKECRCITVDGPARDRWRAFWRRYAEPAVEYGSLRVFRLRSEDEAERKPAPPFLSLPGVQEAAFTEAEEGRRINDWRRAEAVLKALVAAEPELAEARFKLAEVYLLTQRPAEAKREAAAARRLGLDSGGLLLLEAGLAVSYGDRAAALAKARRAVERWPAPRPLAIAAATSWDVGQKEEAHRLITAALRLNPWDPEVRKIADRLR